MHPGKGRFVNVYRRETMEEKKGYVEHIIYRNQENGYTVFEFVSQEEGEEYLDTCVGTFPFSILHCMVIW